MLVNGGAELGSPHKGRRILLPLEVTQSKLELLILAVYVRRLEVRAIHRGSLSGFFRAKFAARQKNKSRFQQIRLT